MIRNVRAIFYTGAVTIMALMETAALRETSEDEMYGQFDALTKELGQFVAEIDPELGVSSGTREEKNEGQNTRTD